MDEITNYTNNNPVGCIELDGVVYAVGIIWNRANVNSSQKKIIENLAESLDTNLVCYANHALGKLYGLADTRLGHKKNMPSLASRFDRSADKGMLGAWCVGNNKQWYVLAINDDGGIILDKAYESEDGALSEFYSLFNDDWSAVYCPEHWGISEAISDEISSLFVCRPKKITTIRLEKKYVIKCVASSFVFMLILVCVWFLYTYINNKTEPEIVMAESDNSYPVEERLPPPPMPLKKMLSPKDFINTCVNSIQFYRFYADSIPGWGWSGVAQCIGDEVRFDLIKNDGTVLWLEAIKNFPNTPRLSNSEENGTIAWRIEGGVTDDKEHLPPALNDSKKFLVDSFSELFINIEFYNLDSVSYWKSESFSINVKYNPEMFSGILNSAYGVVLNSIQYSSTSGDWVIKGKIYSDIVE